MVTQMYLFIKNYQLLKLKWVYLIEYKICLNKINFKNKVLHLIPCMSRVLFKVSTGFGKKKVFFS